MNSFVLFVNEEGVPGPMRGPYENDEKAIEIILKMMEGGRYGHVGEYGYPLTEDVIKDVKTDGGWNFDTGGSLYLIHLADESEMVASESILAQFKDHECPDCGELIPKDVQEGDECENCSHVFHLPQNNVEP